MYITGFYLLLSDLLIQFTSLHCPYVFALMPQLKPNELYFCMSLTLLPCFLQLLESIIIVLTIWFYTLASWDVCQFKLGLLDFCFEIQNMLGCCCVFFFNNNWFSHRQQLSAISGDSKYCICKCSVRVTQKGLAACPLGPDAFIVFHLLHHWCAARGRFNNFLT